MDHENISTYAKRLYSYLPLLDSPRAYALIDTEALCENYTVLRDKALSVNPNAVTVATVKADAYGHSAAICVPALLGAGCRFFAVSSMEEALDVRHIINGEGIYDAEILILGYTHPKYASLASKHNITVSLVSAEYTKSLLASLAAGQRIKTHVAVDSGMNRLGYLAHTDEDIRKSVAEIAPLFKDSKIKICGAFSHFFVADTEGERERTNEQYNRFSRLVALLSENGCTFPLVHICNTAGIMLYTDFALDAVRMGISLYGAVPYNSPEKDRFSPVMKLCTIVSHIHTVKAGESVGYGGTFVADKDIRVATIPIGYADGFVRAYGGAEVSLRGRKAKIIGRICMDQCMIDISGIDEVTVGDEVVLFGESAQDLTKLAKKANTIEYECLCLISSRIPRIKIK